mgnify:CR=1 FL=1
MSHKHTESSATRDAYLAALAGDIAENAAGDDYETYVVECMLPAARSSIDDRGDSVIETDHGCYSLSFAVTHARKVAQNLQATSH